MRWKSAQYAATKQFPCLTALTFLLASSLELALVNARVIAILNPCHVVYVLYPCFIQGSINA
jgi:hypothetical protein